jgi:hypothetical protein
MIKEVIHTAATVLKDLKAPKVVSVADGLQTHTEERVKEFECNMTEFCDDGWPSV